MLLDTVHKRKSFALTSVILCLLVLLMFLTGMKYLDPPEEKGITITFGTDSRGMGEIKPPAPAKSAPQVPQTPQEPIPTPSEPVASQEQVVTQETDQETIVVPEKKKKTTPKQETKPKVAETPKEPEKPKPSSETTDALANILGASKKTDANTSGGGQGNDNVAGHKGSPDGNPYSSSFYGSGGSGGSGSGKGWGLNGRNLEDGQKIPQDCNESGRVVVQIEVDRSGKVVKATPGVKGTTNSAQCLLDAARKTAQTYRWNADPKAPVRQIGFIEINFRLGE